VDVGVESRTLVRGLNLRVESGSMLAVLGPNGSGKSLSLHTFAGLRAAHAGRLLIADRPIGEWTRRTLARELALLPQNVEDPFPANVLETVLLGRHPHIGRWQWESAEDIACSKDALAAVGLAGYEERDIFTLSGGERRRAALAAVLTQNPRVFLAGRTDQPAGSQPPSRGNCNCCAREPTRAPPSSSRCMIPIWHARFADHALLIGAAGDWRWGGAGEILTSGHLSELYQTRFDDLEVNGRRVFFQA